MRRLPLPREYLTYALTMGGVVKFIVASKNFFRADRTFLARLRGDFVRGCPHNRI